MSTEKVLKNLEGAINRISKDIMGKKCGSGADKLDSFSKLINSYSRLLDRSKNAGYDPMEDGDPDYQHKLENAGSKGKRNVTR